MLSMIKSSRANTRRSGVRVMRNYVPSYVERSLETTCCAIAGSRRRVAGRAATVVHLCSMVRYGQKRLEIVKRSALPST